MTNEWGFECYNYYKATFAHTAQMFGGLFSFIGGWFSDRYGRKIVVKSSFVAFFFTISVCEIINQKFSFDTKYKYAIYLIAQFLLGFFIQVGYVSAYILTIELCHAAKTTFITAFNCFMYVAGLLILMAVAYWSRDWHIINSFLAIFSFLVLLLISLILPESPRYLLSKKKYKECYAVLKRLAQVNNRSDELFSEDEFLKQADLKNRPDKNTGDMVQFQDQVYFHEMQSLLSLKIMSKISKVKISNSSDLIDMVKSGQVNETQQVENEKNVSVSAFLVNPVKNLVYSLLIMFVWAVLAMTYFAISLGITSISKGIDPYVMYMFSCIAEAVGYLSCYFHDRCSLKRLCIILLICMEIVVILQIFLPIELAEEMTWRTALIILVASAGKAFSAAAFGSIYVYTIRMYPTAVRNTMYAACVSFGRVGSLISPQVNLLRLYTWQFMPNVLFSVSTALGAFILALLPDPSKLV